MNRCNTTGGGASSRPGRSPRETRPRTPVATVTGDRTKCSAAATHSRPTLTLSACRGAAPGVRMRLVLLPIVLKLPSSGTVCLARAFAAAAEGP